MGGFNIGGNKVYWFITGLEITEKVMKKKMEGELDCTIDLAILRGTFEGWNPELEK